jgi:hypothetical protein
MRMSDIVDKLRKEIERTVELDILHHDAANEIETLTQRLREAEEYGEIVHSALETALPFVSQSVEQLHDSLKGYKPHVHEQADKDMEQVNAALSLPKPWGKK